MAAKRSTFLKVERLEAREVPACSLTLSGRILTIQGTSRADQVRLDQQGGILTVLHKSGNETDSRRESFRVSSVSKVVFSGGAGNDTFRPVDQDRTRITIPTEADGGAGDDWLWGGDASNVLKGGLDNDLLYGGTAKDTIRGGDGNDSMHGFGGDDKLFGDGGRDRLYGGAGSDFLDPGSNDPAEYCPATWEDYHAYRWAIYDPNDTREISPNDVIQKSDTATCQFAAAMAAVAHAGTTDLKSKIRYRGNGAYEVDLFNRDRGGRLQTFIVHFEGDRTGPFDPPPSPRTPGEFWPLLLERAYRNMTGPGINMSVEPALFALTGREPTVKRLAFLPYVLPELDSNFAYFRGRLAEGKPIVAGTAPQIPVSPLRSGHAYTVLRFFEQAGTRMVRLRNPWGFSVKNEPAPQFDPDNDGDFEITWDDFRRKMIAAFIG